MSLHQNGPLVIAQYNTIENVLLNWPIKKAWDAKKESGGLN